ncbi:MAG: 4-hydroxyphenylacetate isomerase [Gammaproteobacteria bacterium]|jgi:5-oxopent-3-ene-1,2,5-tricarboxylate decarboxylase / 2-hydroxyhepta-2,4-diene-1,7-dioate isomerase|nr:4-hydroxyphenylacetate isomerase [Gammaproteobacteria bacterium]
MSLKNNIDLANVREVICVALNYIGHVEEVENQFDKAPYKEPPKTPVLFIKPQNTITQDKKNVLYPDEVSGVQAGPSLAVVIGKQARKVSEMEAMDYIKGYTIFNDFSLPEQSYFRPAITSKCYDSFGPLGPAIVDKEAVADPHDLEIKTIVNGELRQEAHTDELVWSIPALLEFISSFKTLYPGEVIATGFPAGRVDVSVGDEVSIEIESVGCLSNTLVSEKDFYAV